MRRLASAVLALLAVLALTTSAFAQGGGASSTGTIQGRVMDSQGAVLPGVTVTATSPSALGAQTAVTSETGNYRFPAIPPGEYELTFELAGFNTLKRSGIQISLGFTATINVELALEHFFREIGRAADQRAGGAHCRGGMAGGDQPFDLSVKGACERVGRLIVHAAPNELIALGRRGGVKRAPVVGRPLFFKSPQIARQDSLPAASDARSVFGLCVLDLQPRPCRRASRSRRDARPRAWRRRLGRALPFCDPTPAQPCVKFV